MGFPEDTGLGIEVENKEQEERYKKYQYTAEVGDVVEYKGKEYVIVGTDICVAGMSREVCIVRTGVGCFKSCKSLYDEKINELKRIRTSIYPDFHIKH